MGTPKPTRETICGTTPYLAPEIINKEPHDHNVDVWAAGVLLFEMIVGVTPFGGVSKLDVFQRIITGDLSFPLRTDEAAKDLIQKLLTFKREDRLLLENAVRHNFVVMTTSPTHVEVVFEHNSSDDSVASRTSHTSGSWYDKWRMSTQDNCDSILPIGLARFGSNKAKISALSSASTTASRPGCSSPCFSGASFSTASHEDWHSSLGRFAVQRRLTRVRSLTPEREEREDEVNKVDDVAIDACVDELNHVNKVLCSSIEQGEDADLPGLVPLIKRIDPNNFVCKASTATSLGICTRERAKPKAAAHRKGRRVCVGTMFPSAGA